MHVSQLVIIYLIIAVSATVLFELKTDIEETAEENARNMERCVSEAVKDAGRELMREIYSDNYRITSVEETFFSSLAAGLGMDAGIMQYQLYNIVPVLCVYTETGYEISYYGMQTDSGYYRMSFGMQPYITETEEGYCRLEPDEPARRTEILEMALNYYISCIIRDGCLPENIAADLPECDIAGQLRTIGSRGVLVVYIQKFMGRTLLLSDLYAAQVNDSGKLYVIEAEDGFEYHYPDCSVLSAYRREHPGRREICFASLRECAEFGAEARICCEPFAG